MDHFGTERQIPAKISLMDNSIQIFQKHIHRYDQGLVMDSCDNFLFQISNCRHFGRKSDNAFITVITTLTNQDIECFQYITLEKPDYGFINIGLGLNYVQKAKFVDYINPYKMF